VIKSRARQLIKPMKHQLVSLKHDKTTPIVFDASDPGTGKTAVRIWAWAERRRKGGGCMLVLAPRSLLKVAWANDFAKFAPDMKVSVASADNREKAFTAEADVYITNHDASKWLVKQKAPFWKRFIGGDVCADEVTAYKHHTSQRSRAALRIFQPAKTKTFTHKSVLSATPTSNGVCNIWHPVALLDNGLRLGGSFYGFRNSVAAPEAASKVNKDAINWIDKEGAEEAVFGLISDIVIRHEFEKCVDIPKTHRYSVEYELTPKQRKAYDDMDIARVLVLGDKKTGVKMTAVNAAAVATKLCQIASGAVYDNDKIKQIIDLSRYEAIIDMVEVRKHPLVFFFWKHQRDALVAEATARKMRFAVIDGDTSDAERSAIEAVYQSGGYDVLFGHPKSLAHGWTLTAGTSTIWSGPTHDLEWWLQGSRRQARIGQKEKTEIVVCLAKDTIEERIYHEILMPKDGRMKTLLDLFASSTA
jgi:hypothetical protein